MRTRLRWSAALFAVLWTAGMILWSSEARGPAGIVIFSAAGVLVGVLWYAAMKRYMAWHLFRRLAR